MDREQLYESFDNGVIGLDDIIDISQKDGYNQALEDFTSLLIDNLEDFGEGQNVIMAIDRGRIVRLKKQLVK